MTADDAPVELACKLSSDEHAARIAYDRDGHRMRLTYRSSAAARVREFVRRERQCCPFLRFATEQHPDGFVVIIDAPAELGSAADALFAPYTGGGKR